MAIQPVGQPVYDTPFEPAGALGLAAEERRTWLMNRASWGAILAGVAAALLVQFMLTLLGTGVSLASLHLAPAGAPEPSVAGLSMAAAIWWVISGVVAALVGGIVAGRLSGSARHSTAAWHGFVAWCVTVLLFLTLGLQFGGLRPDELDLPLRGNVDRASGVAYIGNVMAEYQRVQDEVSLLLNPNDPAVAQSRISRYVQAVDEGRSADADAAHQPAIDALTHAANISPQEAQTRLDQMQQRLVQTAQQTRQKAETVRKDVARGALFAFAGLLLTGIAGIVGGGLGTPRRLVA